MSIPKALQPYVDLFQVLDGYGQIWSPCGQFLGLLSSISHNPNSIINSYGHYGSPHSLTSIQNPQGIYGSCTGTYSPYNPNCINPPVIFYQGHPLLLLTRNLTIFTNDLIIVDPDLMLTIYEEFSNSKPKPIARRWETLRAALDNITNSVHASQNPLKFTL